MDKARDFVGDVEGMKALVVGEAPPVWVEDLAARYIAAMETVDDGRPVFVAGYSFGGLVAHEIARQVRQAGRPAAVVLIDTRSAALAGQVRRVRSRRSSPST